MGYKLSKLVGWIFLLSAFSTVTQAQNGTLRGEVIDEQEEKVLAGANVKIQGTSRGTASDNDGKFVFKSLPEGNYTIVISYVGLILPITFL